MTEHEDDLTAFEGSAVGRALRAPGSRAELAGEEQMVAAFRAAMGAGGTHGSLRRIVGRLGVGGTTVVATLALTSGVAAAAYTNTLPDPVQSAVHAVLPIVAAPAHGHRAVQKGSPSGTSAAGAAKSSTAAPSAASAPTAVGSPQAAGRTHAPSSAPSPAISSAGSSPGISSVASSGSSSGPSAGSSPTTPPVVPHRRPAAVSVAVSAKRVPTGSVVAVTGVVTASDGHLLRNRRVALLAHVPGTPGWTRLARGRTDQNGSVTLASVALVHTTVLRLRAPHHTRSPRARVVIVPQVSVVLTGGALGVTTAGGSPGDKVVLLRMVRGVPHRVAVRRLDQTGAASFPVHVPTRHNVRYVVRLVRTPLHAAKTARIVISPSG